MKLIELQDHKGTNLNLAADKVVFVADAADGEPGTLIEVFGERQLLVRQTREEVLALIEAAEGAAVTEQKCGDERTNFIEFKDRDGKPAKLYVRADSIDYVSEEFEDSATTVIGYSNQTIAVDNTPAEVLALIAEAESANSTPAQPPPERPATIGVDDLRVGDDLELGGFRITYKFVRRDGDLSFGNFSGRPNDVHAPKKQVADLLARGVPVYRDGKLISGWPAGEPVDQVLFTEKELADGIRIAELEKQNKDLEDRLAAWKEAASIELVEGSTEPIMLYETPEALRERLKQLYRWAATETGRADELQERLKQSEAEQPKEDLEPNRVMVTAYALAKKAADAPVKPLHDYSSLGPVRKKTFYRAITASIEAIYGGGPPKLIPYRASRDL